MGALQVLCILKQACKERNKHKPPQMIDPRKKNMEPEYDGSQKDSPIQGVHFPVPC